ncbi:MAG: twin-arginine translocase subunit TatB [Acidobacteria bacterium]|nr:MAG: twin-arginine translocase subunit TatB [Acidobacteriota bacterium]
MFNIGPLELLAILVIALLVVGPEELPRAARRVAAFIGELRRQGEEVRTQVREMIDDAVSEEDMRSTVDSIDKVRSAFSLNQAEESADEESQSSDDRAGSDSLPEIPRERD